MKKLIASLFTCSSLLVFSQQDQQFTQNMFNKLLTNPGYAGTSKGICANALYRLQWSGFPGAPKTGVLSADAFFAKIKGGVGLNVMTDQLGAEKGTYAKLAYSYHLPVGAGVLGIGLEAGMLQKSINGNWIAPDGTNGATDPLIPTSGTSVSQTSYDLGLGLFYSSEKLYVGLSSTHLPEQSLSDLSYTVARTYYLTAGYNYEISPALELKPSIFVKSITSPTQIDVNALLQWNRKVFGGLTYRYTDAVAAIVGYNHALPSGANLRIAYSYDYTTSAIKNGSHEISVGFCFIPEIKMPKQIHQNVRFMN